MKKVTVHHFDSFTNTFHGLSH